MLTFKLLDSAMGSVKYGIYQSYFIVQWSQIASIPPSQQIDILGMNTVPILQLRNRFREIK